MLNNSSMNKNLDIEYLSMDFYIYKRLETKNLSGKNLQDYILLKREKIFPSHADAYYPIIVSNKQNYCEVLFIDIIKKNEIQNRNNKNKVSSFYTIMQNPLQEEVRVIAINNKFEQAHWNGLEWDHPRVFETFDECVKGLENYLQVGILINIFSDTSINDINNYANEFLNKKIIHMDLNTVLKRKIGAIDIKSLLLKEKQKQNSYYSLALICLAIIMLFNLILIKYQFVLQQELASVKNQYLVLDKLSKANVQLTNQIKKLDDEELNSSLKSEGVLLFLRQLRLNTDESFTIMTFSFENGVFSADCESNDAVKTVKSISEGKGFKNIVISNTKRSTTSNKEVFTVSGSFLNDAE